MSTKPQPSASLYVGDLLNDVTEGMLFELFSTVGPVALVRVCRDTLTRRSLGYAYVNFHSVVDAERALDTLNNSAIKGRPCRIMWSQRDPSIRKSGLGNIYIKNLDANIGHKELYDTFSAFGSILSCKVSMDEQSGQSKGFGFVHFETVDAAERAIQTVNGMSILGKEVYVGKFVPKKERIRQKESSWSNVYIKDIDPKITEEQLRQKFEEFGKTTSVKLMKNEDGSTKGFGFVNFEKHSDAVKAVEALHQFELGSKKLWCGPAQKKSEREQELKKKFRLLKMEQMTKYQGINLYIKNLEDEIDEDRLRRDFSVFGNIRSLKIMFDEKGNSKGFGFVCFTTPEEAQRAIADMNGQVLQGCNKPLYVALHEPKEFRRQKLSQRHANRSKRSGVPAPSPMYAGGQPMYYNNPPMHGYAPYPSQMPRLGRAWPQQAGPYTSFPAQPQLQSVPGGRGRGNQPGNSGGRGNNLGGSRGRGGGQRGVRTNQPQPGVAPEQLGPAPDGHLTVESLAQFPFEQQKLLLGERLYPLIHKLQPNRAGKITGMLLDSGWSVEDLLGLVNDEEKLSGKVDEAVAVLDRHASQAPEEQGEQQPPQAEQVSAPNGQ